MATTTFRDKDNKPEAISADTARHNDAVRAFQLFGGRDLTNHTVRNALDAHDLIMRGISSQALIHLVDQVSVLSSGDALNKAIGMSMRTLQRKKSAKHEKGRLSTEQSSRAWQFAEILAQATDVLGNQEAARGLDVRAGYWLRQPSPY